MSSLSQLGEGHLTPDHSRIRQRGAGDTALVVALQRGAPWASHSLKAPPAWPLGVSAVSLTGEAQTHRAWGERRGRCEA